jgi:hypothetical protein
MQRLQIEVLAPRVIDIFDHEVHFSSDDEVAPAPRVSPPVQLAFAFYTTAITPFVCEEFDIEMETVCN